MYWEFGPLYGFGKLKVPPTGKPTNATGVPSQVSRFEAETVGNGLTVTFTALEFAEHPFEFVTATEYDPPEFTVIEGVVSPVFHK